MQVVSQWLWSSLARKISIAKLRKFISTSKVPPTEAQILRFQTLWWLLNLEANDPSMCFCSSNILLHGFVMLLPSSCFFELLQAEDILLHFSQKNT